MPDNKIPELRIGQHDGVWTVAMADQFGWVKIGTGDPLDDDTVETWTPLVPAVETVWGWKSSSGAGGLSDEYFSMDSERMARQWVANCEGRVRLARRALGPWGVVETVGDAS